MTKLINRTRLISIPITPWMIGNRLLTSRLRIDRVFCEDYRVATQRFLPTVFLSSVPPIASRLTNDTIRVIRSPGFKGSRPS